VGMIVLEEFLKSVSPELRALLETCKICICRIEDQAPQCFIEAPDRYTAYAVGLLGGELVERIRELWKECSSISVYLRGRRYCYFPMLGLGSV